MSTLLPRLRRLGTWASPSLLAGSWAVGGAVVAQDLRSPTAPATPTVPASHESALYAYLAFGKGTLVLAPRRAGFFASQGDVATLQPNVGPSAGVALTYGDYLGASVGRSVDGWQAGAAQRGRSRVTHYEVHGARGRFGFDLYRQDYRGFFLKVGPARDLRPFNDAGWNGGAVDRILPDMRLVASGLALTYVDRPERFSLDAALLHREAPRVSGWSLLAMAQYFETVVDNPAPLTPASLRGRLGPADAQVTGLRSESLALLPGVGGVLVADGWFAGGAAAWGWGIEDYRLHGSDERHPAALATVGSVRATAGYFGDDGVFAGLQGVKGLMTTAGATMSLTHTVSQVQAFAGRQF